MTKINNILSEALKEITPTPEEIILIKNISEKIKRVLYKNRTSRINWNQTNTVKK